MPRLRREIATRVTASLRETEDAVDTALAQASDFLAMLPAARREAQVSASMGHDAIERVAAAISALTEARRELVAAHEVLADVQQQLGLGTTAFGPFIDKPDYPPKVARLSLVDSKAA
jgi:hypothetical protein